MLIADGGDDLQFGRSRLNRVVELGEPSVVAARSVEPILVPDLHVAKPERRRVAVLRSLRSPFRSRGPGNVFNLVQRVLDIRLQVQAGLNVFTPQRISG